jgi:SAM-dependent methyltransferase
MSKYTFTNSKPGMNHYQDFWDREHAKGTYFQGAGHESREVVDYVSRIKDRYGKFKHPDSRAFLTNNGLIDKDAIRDNSAYVNIETNGAKCRILEIGCGYGHVGAFIAPFVEQYDGVDISSRIVNDGNHAIDKCDITNMRLHHTPDSDLSQFADKSYDLILTCAVFIHTEKSVTEHYLRETRRLLKDTGVFCHHMNVTSGHTLDLPSDDISFPGARVYNTSESDQLFRDAGLDVRKWVDGPEFDSGRWSRSHLGIVSNSSGGN